MGQQVERVLDASRTRQRTRIDRHAQSLGQLAVVECLGLLRQFDGPFEQASIQVGGDHPFAKFLQRALRKRRFLGPQAPQHHLHSQIENGQLDHLGVGDAEVPLHEYRHGHHRRRTRLFSGAGGPIHRDQLILKRSIEQLMPMQPQKSEQLPYPTEALQDELLLPRRPNRRCPMRDRHLHASSGQRPASASDHRPHNLSIPRLQ